MISVTHNGRVFASDDPAKLLARGVPQAEIDAAILEQTEMQTLASLRASIAAAAGDDRQLLGTTADAAAIALHGLAELADKLAAATTLAEVRDAAQPFAALTADLLSKVEAGTVVLPFTVKGIPSVLQDFEDRANAVSTAFQNQGA